MAAARDDRRHDRQGKSVIDSDASCRGAFGRTASDSIPWPLVIGGIFLLIWLSGPAARVQRLRRMARRRLPARNDPG